MLTTEKRIKTDGNDRAYARSRTGTDGIICDEGARGLTKREYFAAIAMQGMLAHSHGGHGYIPREGCNIHWHSACASSRTPTSRRCNDA